MKRTASHKEPMAIFRRLGMLVENRWRNENYRETAFPKIAAEILAKHSLVRDLDLWDIIRSLRSNQPLTSQQDLDASFSNLPITLFVGTKFYIDIYFWLDGTTAIHQHGFAGAFQVLLGSSLHTHYQFTATEKVNPHFAIGKMHVKKTQLLSTGEIKQIIPGNRYIHSLFHLDRPSATLTIRTFAMPSALPQFSYFKPGIAVDPFFRDPANIKRVQSINVLLSMQHPGADSIITDMLSESDLPTAFTVLEAAYRNLSGNVLEEQMGVSPGSKRFAKLLGFARARHGKNVDIFIDVFTELQRQGRLIQRRSYVTGSELRFFLALLLNVAGRKQILHLIRQRFPEKPPVEKILDWVEELSQLRLFGSNEPNAIGVEGFGNQHLLVLECLLKDKTLKRTQGELRKVFRDANARKLDEQTGIIYGNLKDTSLLKPLFAPDV